MRIPIFPTIFLLIGLAMAWSTVSTLARQAAIASDSRKVTGAVTAHRTSESSTGHMVYTPVIEYEVDGAKRTFTPEVASSHPPDVGSKQTLLVDRDDPSRVVVDSFLQRWFKPLMLGMLAAMFLGIGWLFSAVRTKRRNDAGPG